MPDSNGTSSPFVELLDETIDALTYLREGGVKMTPVDPAVWQAFVTPVPTVRASVLPSIPEPVRAMRSSVVADTPQQRETALEMFRAEIAQCQRCSDCAEAARVLGSGSPFNAQVMVLNGACLEGEESVAQGSRLEGESGELFNKMFAAIGLSRSDLYITSVLKCRVTGRPKAATLQACSDYLQNEIRLVNPKVLVLLGAVAVKAIYPTGGVSAGRVAVWNRLGNGLPTLTLHHPMRLLLLGKTMADPLKRENWAALQLLRDKLKD
ncbi:MAG: uracil-DNA glycosylase [Kiritimatiellia bacterium]